MENAENRLKWLELLPQSTRDTLNSLVTRAALADNVCPAPKNILRALDLTAPEEVKAVIVGQDPYHTPGVANGLAFSVNPDATIPPSLKNIYAELVNDMKCDYPKNGELVEWAKRGVLLLNATLSVEEHKPNSHSSWGWDKVTRMILQKVSEFEQPIVFLLWGAYAQKLRTAVLGASAEMRPGGIWISTQAKKAVLASSHPSPLSATKSCAGTPAFIGSRPFSRANKLLTEMGAEPVDWRL